MRPRLLQRRHHVQRAQFVQQLPESFEPVDGHARLDFGTHSRARYRVQHPGRQAHAPFPRVVDQNTAKYAASAAPQNPNLTTV